MDSGQAGDARRAVALLTVAVLGVLGCHLRWGWVPILDSANLVFHEAGHPIFGVVSERLAVYGGTLMQLLIPGACAWTMHRQGMLTGMRASLVWLAENLLNVARYMADARAHQLPLVGGVDPQWAHDWTEILSRWGVLSWDVALANGLRAVALALMAWLLWRAWQPARDDT